MSARQGRSPRPASRSPQPMHINVTPPQQSIINNNQYNAQNIADNYSVEQLLSIAGQRWFSNDEMLHILQTFQAAGLPTSAQPPNRPVPGSLIVYDRTFTKRWRSDGYSWKGSDRHVELKVDGKSVINCCYAHSNEFADLHRRSYWLLDELNPTIGKSQPNGAAHAVVGRYVMVHYLDNCQTRKRSSSRDMTGQRIGTSNSTSRSPPAPYRGESVSPGSEYREMYDDRSVSSGHSTHTTNTNLTPPHTTNPQAAPQYVHQPMQQYPRQAVNLYAGAQPQPQLQPQFPPQQQTLLHSSQINTANDLTLQLNNLQNTYISEPVDQYHNHIAVPDMYQMRSDVSVANTELPSLADIDVGANPFDNPSIELNGANLQPISHPPTAYILEVSPLTDTYMGGAKLLIVVQDSDCLQAHNIMAVFGNVNVPLERITQDVFRCTVPGIPNIHLQAGQPANVALFITDGINFTNSIQFIYTPMITPLSPTLQHRLNSENMHTDITIDPETVIQEQELLVAMLDRLDLLLSSAISMASVPPKMQRSVSGLSDDSNIPNTPTALSLAKSSSMSVSLTPSEAQRLLVARAEYARLHSTTLHTTPALITNLTLSDIKKTVRNTEIDDTIEGLMLLMLQRAIDTNIVTDEHLVSVDLEGRQLIHFAAGLGFESFVAFLIEHDVSVNCTDNNLKTPLHYSAEAGDAYMTTELLAAGADDKMKDKSGITAMQTAAMLRATGKHNHVLSVFIDSAAAEQPTHIDTADNNQETAAEYRKRYNEQANIKQHVRQHSDSLTVDTNGNNGRPDSPVSSGKRGIDDVSGYFSDASAYDDDAEYMPSIGKQFSSMTLTDMGVEVDEIEREVAGSDESFARCVRRAQRKIRGFLYRRHNAAKKVQAVARGYIVRKKLSKPPSMDAGAGDSVIQQSVKHRNANRGSQRNSVDQQQLQTSAEESGYHLKHEHDVTTYDSVFK